MDNATSTRSSVTTEGVQPPKDPQAFARYLLVAFSVTWLLWIPALAWARITGSTLPTMDAGPGAWAGLSGTGLVMALGFQLAVYGPLLGALVALRGDAAARNSWVRSLVRVRVHWRWYAFVLGAPLLLNGLVLLIAGLIERTAPDPWATGAPALALLPIALLVQLLTSGLEEPGWRGFALPWLRRSLGREEAAWRLGWIWAAWHLPFVIWLYLDAPLLTIPLTLAGFAMGIIAMSFVHAWVFERTGSVWMCILLHAWANTCNTYAFAWSRSPVAPVLTAVITWLFVAWLLKMTPGWKELRAPEVQPVSR